MADRIYVSGPMSGRPGLNFEAFHVAAAELAALGWEVENPAEKGVIDCWSWEDYLRYDLTRLVTCNAIYLLPGWMASRGARLERHVAASLGFRELSYYRPPVEPVSVALSSSLAA